MEVASNFQNVAFQLIRSIVDAKVIVPEVSENSTLSLTAGEFRNDHNVK